MKRLVYILLFLIAGQISFSQQLPLYSQYLYDRFLINPAVTGSDGYTSINLTAREQWVGISRAPQVYSLSFQTRFLKRGIILKTTKNARQVYRPKNDGKVGLGVSLFSFESGLVQRNGFKIAYAYHLWLRSTTQLSLGLSFTGYYFRINEKEIALEDPNDPMLNDNLRRGIFVPDASFGVYFLNRYYNIGFSADQLFGAIAKIGSNAYTNYTMARTYYLFGSYNYEFGKDFELRPSALVKMSEQLRPQADVGLNIIYKQSFWTGLSYRTSGALIAIFGIRYKKLHIGYSMDYTLQNIQRITYGSHEINLAWKFGDSLKKFRWLDRY